MTSCSLLLKHCFLWCITFFAYRIYFCFVNFCCVIYNLFAIESTKFFSLPQAVGYLQTWNKACWIWWTNLFGKFWLYLNSECEGELCTSFTKPGMVKKGILKAFQLYNFIFSQFYRICNKNSSYRQPLYTSEVHFINL